MLLLLAVAGYVAAAMWPLANFMAINYSQIAAGAYGRPDDLYFVTATMILAGLAISFVGSRIRHGAGLRLLTVFAVAVFLLFTSLALRGVLRGAGIQAFSTLLTAAGVSVSLVLVWLISRVEPVRVLVSVASVFALTMALAGLMPQVLASWAKPESTANAPIDGSAYQLSGENVYLIVLDEYAGEGALRELGMDNRPFIEAVQERGFKYDPAAKSNYIATHVSIMSILEGEYPVTDTSVRYVDRSSFYPAAINSGYAPRFIRDLKASGYTTKRISNWWGGCSEKVFDVCVLSPNSTQSYAIQTFLQPTLLRSVVDAVLQRAGGRRDTALEIFQDQFAQLKRQSPYLLLIHHLSPHQPYDRNADCSVRDVPDSDKALTIAEKAPLYVAATRCVNAELLRAVDLIERDDPNGIVAIISDHGSDFHVDWQAPIADWSEQAVDERSQILRLSKLPTYCQDWDKEGLGQVNGTRLIWACLTGTQPQYLPEHTYVTAYEFNPDFGLAAKVR